MALAVAVTATGTHDYAAVVPDEAEVVHAESAVDERIIDAELGDLTVLSNPPPVPRHEIFFFSISSPSLFRLSNLHPCFCVVGGCDFKSVEHYFVYEKARLFDPPMCDVILRNPRPRDIKALSKKIKNYDEKRWQEVKEGVMLRALQAKFTQNVDAMEDLRNTGGALLVEATGDSYWGAGHREPMKHPRTTWGLNRLGHLLMKVRDEQHQLHVPIFAESSAPCSEIDFGDFIKAPQHDEVPDVLAMTTDEIAALPVADSLYSESEVSDESCEHRGRIVFAPEGFDNVSQDQNAFTAPDDPHRTCDCQVHSAFTTQLGCTWISCFSGHGHWAPLGTVPDLAPCHLCPRASGQRVAYCAGAAQHHSNYHNANHPKLLFSPGYVNAPTPNTCALLAVAEALQLTPAQVWEKVRQVAGSECTVDLLPAPGFDERFFAIVAVLYGLEITLKGRIPPGTPRKLGLRAGRPFSFHLTTLEGVPHWEYRGTSKKPLEIALNTRAPTRLVADFVSELEEHVDEYGNKLMGNWAVATTNVARAKVLASEVKNGIEGICKREEGKMFVADYTKKLDSMVDFAKPRQYQIRAITGFAGCGKSAPLISFLRKSLKKYGGKGVWKMAAARKFLRDFWADDIKAGRNAYQLCTWETALARNAGVLIIDEAGLLPSGYLDLIMIGNEAITHVILLGAPDQCRFNSVHPDSRINGNLSNEMTNALRLTQAPYSLHTHRSPQVFYCCFNIPGTSPVRGTVKVQTALTANIPALYASDIEAKTAVAQGNVAYTIPSAQGRTFKTLQFRITQSWIETMGDATIISALERVSENFIFVPAQGVNLQRIDWIAALLNYDTTFDDQLAGRIPLTHALDYESRMKDYLVGTRVERMPEAKRLEIYRKRKAERASGQYTPTWERAPAQTKTLLQSIPNCPPPAVPLQEPELPEHHLRTHLPAPTSEFIVEQLLAGRNMLREAREIVNGKGMTVCFLDEEKIGPEGAWFPKQEARDEALLEATIKKRLVRGTVEGNMKELHDSEHAGYILYLSYCKLHKWDPDERVAFDLDLYLDCVSENETVKLTKKTIAALNANVGRSDPDWDIVKVKHFLKTQLKGKMEAFAQPAKAGQTLATCHDFIVIVLGAFNRYMRKVKAARRPDNLFIHCGTSSSDLNDYAKRHWRDGVATTNDYTAFDSSQRGDSVHLTANLARRFMVPEDLVQLLIFWKTHTISDIIGVKQTGRDTGEPGTYDDNCDFNMAIMASQYSVKQLHTTTVLIGGDDSAADAKLKVSRRWKVLSKLFYIISKTEYTAAPQFCGWCITSQGVFKDPMILLLKTLYHAAKGDLANVVESYAYESSWAYRMSDLLYSYCSFEQLMAQHWIVEYYHFVLPEHVREYLFSAHFSNAAAAEILDALIIAMYSAPRATKRQVKLFNSRYAYAQRVFERNNGGFYGLPFARYLENHYPHLDVRPVCLPAPAHVDSSLTTLDFLHHVADRGQASHQPAWWPFGRRA